VVFDDLGQFEPVEVAADRVPDNAVIVDLLPVALGLNGLHNPVGQRRGRPGNLNAVRDTGCVDGAGADNIGVARPDIDVVVLERAFFVAQLDVCGCDEVVMAAFRRSDHHGRRNLYAMLVGVAFERAEDVLVNDNET
jgi:hypothetical protein